MPNLPHSTIREGADFSALRTADQHLIQITDAALSDAAHRSGEWLVCRPGCTQCCIGAFAISQLDALRLREGLNHLAATDAERADRIRQRAADYIARHAHEFPGDPITGILDQFPEARDEVEDRFESFANEEPCPALDPSTGTCDLYEARPMTCRVFGPPIRSEDGLGVCELCYHGATDEQIAACEMQVDPEGLEPAILGNLHAATGISGQTIVAYCLHR